MQDKSSTLAHRPRTDLPANPRDTPRLDPADEGIGDVRPEEAEDLGPHDEGLGSTSGRTTTPPRRTHCLTPEKLRSARTGKAAHGRSLVPGPEPEPGCQPRCRPLSDTFGWHGELTRNGSTMPSRFGAQGPAMRRQ